MKNLILLFSLIFIVSCSKEANQVNHSPDQDNSIIGGQNVRAGDPRFSSTVGIIMVDDKTGDPTGVCTGTLIRSDVVLTAAHCLVSSDNSKLNFIIYFGNTLLDLSQFNSFRAGISSIAHEKYSNGLGKEAYDVGLIKFSGDLPPGFAPVPILKDDQYLKNGTEIIAAGYGRNKRYSRGSEDGTGQLRQVKLNVTDIKFSDIEFASSSWSKGICLGDSGGPAYVNINGQLYIAGVSNRVLGIGRFNCIYMSVFLRVDKLQSWIEQKLLNL